MSSKSPSSCAIVGVGASAGGLDAFKRLLGALPAGIDLSFVLVQHLDPSRESQLADVLTPSCPLPVVRADDGQKVESGHVYVVPEGREATLVDGSIRLQTLGQQCKTPIDTFLSSLASSNGSKGCGVLLSGTGSDGVHGLGELRGASGITFVQDPETSEYDSLPREAIRAQVADFVGSPEDIAAELAKLAVYLSAPQAPSKSAEEREERLIAQIVALVGEHSGMHFSEYKKTTVTRRIYRRVMLRDIGSLDAYLELLRREHAEIHALVDDLLINVTQFFRDPEVFDCLKAKVVPEILGNKTDADTIRVWVAGCSTGEEVYSILIALIEALDDSPVKPKITIFGTDASEEAIDRARSGVYPASICSVVSPERLSRFFVRTPDGLEIERSLREMCIFARQDVTKDTPFSRIDLMCLRNILIYMDRTLQRKVLAVAHYALSPGGFLVLGTSETPESEDRFFDVFDKQQHI